VIESGFRRPRGPSAKETGRQISPENRERSGGIVKMDLLNLDKLDEKFIWHDQAGLMTQSLGAAAGSGESMTDLALVEPSAEWKEDAIRYRDECSAADGIVNGDGGLLKSDTYEDWLGFLQLKSNEKTVPDGLVPSSTYFAVKSKSGTIVGMIDIRHKLNEFLATRGGHIGYSIRPSLRGNGYGTAMLTLALQKCKQIGLSRVLITCGQDNIRSAKTAMHCGGKEESTEISAREGFRRFWIELK
jgi:predicted acetyltransferase